MLKNLEESIEMLRGLKHIIYEKRFQELGLYSGEENLPGNIRAAYTYYKQIPKMMELISNSHTVLVTHKVWRQCREAEGRAQCDSS